MMRRMVTTVRSLLLTLVGTQPHSQCNVLSAAVAAAAAADDDNDGGAIKRLKNATNVVKKRQDFIQDQLCPYIKVFISVYVLTCSDFTQASCYLCTKTAFTL